MISFGRSFLSPLANDPSRGGQAGASSAAPSRGQRRAMGSERMENHEPERRDIRVLYALVARPSPRDGAGLLGGESGLWR